MRRLALAVGLALATPAVADQPLAVPSPTTCSLSGAVCATREAGGVAVWRKLPRGGRRTLWHAPATGRNLHVADDGRSLVDFYPWANLLEMDAGPDTVMLAFHRPGATPVRYLLRDLVRSPATLPRTSSHRQWARTYGYDGSGRFLVTTVEGRRFVFDPVTGRPATATR